MGQYYFPITEFEGEQKVYDNFVDGRFMALKLMEHSWWPNPFVLAVASKFWRTEGKLAWVGDYADEVLPEDSELVVLRTVGERDESLEYNGFRLEGKLFVNHSKKEYIDLDKYLEEAKKHDKYWIVNPVSLLTAIGNGHRGGDYFGENTNKVGSWAWDIVEITDDDYEKILEYKDITDQVIFWEE